jgi:prepilin peptidase CpaA
MTPTYWQMTCLVLVPAMIYASWIDYSQKRVPNWLNAAIALAGFCCQWLYFGWSGCATGALGLLVGFSALIGFWLIHAMGAGDVKLMAAIGVWFGPAMTLAAFCVGAIVGGVIAAVMILTAGRFWHAFVNFQTIMAKATRLNTLFSDFGSAKSLSDTSQLLPYGIPLTIGSVIILIGQTFSWWVL